MKVALTSCTAPTRQASEPPLDLWKRCTCEPDTRIVQQRELAILHGLAAPKFAAQHCPALQQHAVISCSQGIKVCEQHLHCNLI